MFGSQLLIQLQAGPNTLWWRASVCFSSPVVIVTSSKTLCSLVFEYQKSVVLQSFNIQSKTDTDGQAGQEGLESTIRQLANDMTVTDWSIALCYNVAPDILLKIHFEASKNYVWLPRHRSALTTWVSLEQVSLAKMHRRFPNCIVFMCFYLQCSM